MLQPTANLWSGSMPATLPVKSGWTRPLSRLLAFVVLTILLLGDYAFSFSARDRLEMSQSGSIIKQLWMISFVVLSVPILISYRQRAISLLRRNWLLLLMLAWMVTTAAWAPYPDLTVRRSLAYFMIYVVALGLGTAFEAAADFEMPLYASLVVITLINFGLFALFPEENRSELGASGIYDNKNTAGSVTLICIVAIGASAIWARHWWVRLLLLVALALAWIFLVATNSKTSLGLAILMCGLLPLLGYSIWQSRLFKMGAVLAVICVLALTVFVLNLAGVTVDQVKMLAFGDLTFTQRTFIWDAIWNEVTLRPILGYGFGSFWDVGNSINPISAASPWDFFRSATLINTAHDGYLDTALQMGLIGFSLEVLILLRCVFLLVSVASAIECRMADRRMAMTMLGVVLSLMFNDLLESILFRPTDALAYLFIIIMVQAERWSWELKQERGDFDAKRAARIESTDHPSSLPRLHSSEPAHLIGGPDKSGSGAWTP